MRLREVIDYLIELDDGLDNRGGQVMGSLNIEVPEQEPIILNFDGVDHSNELFDLSKLVKRKS